jgi:hypothetical protein
MEKYIIAKAMTFNTVFELEDDVYVEKYLRFGDVPTDNIKVIEIPEELLHQMKTAKEVYDQGKIFCKYKNEQIIEMHKNGVKFANVDSQEQLLLRGDKVQVLDENYNKGYRNSFISTIDKETAEICFWGINTLDYFDVAIPFKNILKIGE